MDIIRLKKKICMLGQFGVGKTSLTNRFVHNRFEEKYLTTIGVKVCQKTLPPLTAGRGHRNIQYDFLIWDIAGIEKFDMMIKNYYQGAAGALAVADLTRMETVEALQEIVEKFITVVPAAKLIFLGNKIDLSEPGQTGRKKIQKLADNFAGEFLFTSAKTGEKVEEAFLKLAEKVDSSSNE